MDNDEGGLGEGQSALLSNLAAVRAVTAAVEGTLGPKGLDCMLVDESGGVITTNDGVTILQHLEVTHPAARLLIQAARAQERAVGDGTTTAIILAGALIGEGANQILRGVPATRVIEGIGTGVREALAILADLRRTVSDLDDPAVSSVALVAGRGDAGLARVVLTAARALGTARLLGEGFNLAEAVLGLESANDEAFPGVVAEREPASAEMPRFLNGPRVLVIEGALEPESLPSEALASAAGLARAEAVRAAFRAGLDRLVDAGVGLVLTGRGMDESAVRFFVDRGVIGVRRVADRDLRRIASLTGARVASWPLGLDGASVTPFLGLAASVEFDHRARLVRIAGSHEPAEVTIILGGSTAEVVAERERIARDAASSVQHALCGGVVPGGGAVELALSRGLGRFAAGGMSSYGVACVREALRRPLAQLAANAGFHPLEKVEEVYAAQESTGLPFLGIDADSGSVLDLAEAGILDPYPVKAHAIRTAGEVATAILRINNILKMRPGSREEGAWQDPV